MPRAIAVPLREAILRRSRQQQDALTIARELDLSVRTVRHLLQRFRLQPQQGLAPSYRPRLPSCSPIQDAAVQYRLRHPLWGAPFLRLYLLEDFPGQPVPCARSLQRLFARRRLPPALAGCKPQPRQRRADQPHDVWQMDAAERMPLATEQEVSWLRLVDEASGAFLHATVFPIGMWPEVPAHDVRARLRLAFARWGRPKMIRVDDGTPWGSTGDLATDLASWLIGLGIDPWWNPPRRPQDNGVVERSQGTGKRWGEPKSCDSAEQLQSRMDEHDEMQRARYPYREEKSRMQWWRGLTHSGRDYDPDQEEANWELRRVAAFLGDRCVSRRVDQKGQISIYDRNLYVGKMNSRKEVQVIFADEPSRWVVADEKGTILREMAAPEVSAERIMALEVTNRRAGRGSDATPKRPDPPRTHGKTSCRD